MKTTVTKVTCDVCCVVRYLDEIGGQFEDYRVTLFGNGDPEVVDMCPACFASVSRYIGLIKDSEKNCV